MKSNGEFDVLIFGVDNNGLFELKSYGGSGFEEVSDINWDNNMLYFGGTFSGGNESRKIGIYDVIDLVSEVSKARKAYISYVENESDNNLKKSTIVNEDNLKFKGSVTVFPSPFGDEFTIRIVGGDKSKYIASIFDVLGNEVFVDEIFVASWDYQEHIDFLLPVGIYFLKIQDSNGNIHTQKVVKQ